MKKIAIIAAAVALLFTAAPAQAASSDYSTKSKNRYWKIVKQYSPDAGIIGKRSTIEFGVSVCDLLRAGGTLYDLVDITLGTEDYYLIEDYVTTATAAAAIALCPDQGYKFD